MPRNVLLCIAAVAGVAIAADLADARHHHHQYGSSSGWSSGVYGSYRSYGGYSNLGSTWYYAPLYIPADALYGPSHVLGATGAGIGPLAPAAPAIAPRAPLPNNGAPLQGFGVLAGGVAPAPTAPVVRASNRMFQGRAHQLIDIGDGYFRKQNYTDAYQRYKDAVGSAPDVGDSYFREGLALAALGRWELAAKVLKRGLELDSGWPKSQFRLAQVYGDNKLAKTAHWEALAKAATERPNDPDLLFLLGVQLFFDGQLDRSRAFFQQAKALERGAAAHLTPFLEQLATPPRVPAGPRQI